VTAIPREVNEDFVKDADDAYALGLWCADSYWWSSSIGLSNVEPELIVRFGKYLCKTLGPDRIRLRAYKVPEEPIDVRVLELTARLSVRPAFKMRRTAYHVYVNCRPLVRRFFQARKRLAEMAPRWVGPYIAGRFDGDGSFGTRVRIAYTTLEEAEIDARLLSAAGIEKTSVLYYSKANEYCIYIHESDRQLFLSLIGPFSWKASFHPLETAMASLDEIDERSQIYERCNTPAPIDNRVMG
jgi:hypothetical protein